MTRRPLTTRKLLLRTAKILVVAYVILCFVLFVFQEKIIFQPQKLPATYRFSSSGAVEEINLPTSAGILNGLLFKADSAKGLVFYLHGNAGALDSWGNVAERYTALRYDVFMLDYPGYGKSSGSIRNLQQLFDAVQDAYNEMRKRYNESAVVVLGYSLGSGLAAHLAAANHPRLLVLQAPYYSLPDLMRRTFPLIPRVLLRYRIMTNEYLGQCRMPVVLFHGDRDEVVSYESSVRLKSLLKPGDTLVTLKGQGHNGMTENAQYIATLTTILR